jgi:outer membrane protein assembly factor BamB
VHLQGLTALNKETGDIIWQSDVATRYGTPVRVRLGKTDVLVTAGGDVVRAVDGAVLAKEIAPALHSCSPIACGEVLYFIQEQAKAVRLSLGPDGQAKGETVWETTLEPDQYFSSPLCHDGLVYAVSSKRTLTVLDAASGDVVYEKKLRFPEQGDVLSSLALAGDKLFVFNDNGHSLVVEAGRSYRQAGEGTLEGLRSCPVFVGSSMYVRCMETLYCVE